MVQETFVIEEGDKTLEDLIEEQRAKLHEQGKQARVKTGGAGRGVRPADSQVQYTPSLTKISARLKAQSSLCRSWVVC